MQRFQERYITNLKNKSLELHDKLTKIKKTNNLLLTLTFSGSVMVYFFNLRYNSIYLLFSLSNIFNLILTCININGLIKNYKLITIQCGKVMKKYNNKIIPHYRIMSINKYNLFVDYRDFY